MFVTIGLEIHMEMKTKSKMFSSAPVSFDEPVNSNVSPLDIAYPGAMPSLNKKALVNGIKLAKTLNMKIDPHVSFDRKHYFYSDLAKGYQLTQYFHPLGKDGYLDLNIAGFSKRIDIKQLHLEEDTCKQIHTKNDTLLDFNRSGIPLIEIVTYPCFSNGVEARCFAESLLLYANFLGICDGKMQEGSYRFDVNVSCNNDLNIKGNKVEIKNLNSFLNLQKSIDYEVNRQSEIIKLGKKVISETRRYDENKKETVPLREKFTALDYEYFPEPSLLPFLIDEEFVKENAGDFISPQHIYSELTQCGLNFSEIKIIMSNKEIFEFYQNCLFIGGNPKQICKWIKQYLLEYLNKNGFDFTKVHLTPVNLLDIINSLNLGNISIIHAKEIFEKCLKEDCDVPSILNNTNYKLITNETILCKIVEDIVLEFPNCINEYRNGKDRVVGFLVGKVLQKINKQADPATINKLIKAKLEE